MYTYVRVRLHKVNCRIGSLEMFLLRKIDNALVNCRIGSLEIGLTEGR